jgi:hypothetical protein
MSKADEVSRVVAYAALRVQGKGETEAAAALGYKGRGPSCARELAAAALNVYALAPSSGIDWAARVDYFEGKRQEAEAKAQKMKEMTRVCEAIALCDVLQGVGHGVSFVPLGESE